MGSITKVPSLFRNFCGQNFWISCEFPDLKSILYMIFHNQTRFPINNNTSQAKRFGLELKTRWSPYKKCFRHWNKIYKFLSSSVKTLCVLNVGGKKFLVIVESRLYFLTKYLFSKPFQFFQPVGNIKLLIFAQTYASNTENIVTQLICLALNTRSWKNVFSNHSAFFGT